MNEPTESKFPGFHPGEPPNCAKSATCDNAERAWEAAENDGDGKGFEIASPQVARAFRKVGVLEGPPF